MDHGLCLHVEHKLRTVLWGWVGQPMAPEVLEPLRRLRAALDGGGSFRDELGEHVTRREVRALRTRVDALLSAPCFPEPAGYGPAIPWPAFSPASRAFRYASCAFVPGELSVASPASSRVPVRRARTASPRSPCKHEPVAAERVGTAVVLGGGGVLGAVQVGMLRALLDAGVRPDLVVGTSVGAINGAVLAACPAVEVADRLESLWRSPDAAEVFAAGTVARLRELARTRTAAHSAEPLRRALVAQLDDRRIEDLPVPFQCCAARIEDAAEHWFDHGPVVDAVLASAAVPGLLPPVRIGGSHYLDGGLVHSIPLGRAVELGAQRVFVLQVGRIEQAARPRRATRGRSAWSRSRSPAGTASPATWPRPRTASRCTSCRRATVRRRAGTAVRRCATATSRPSSAGSTVPTGLRRPTWSRSSDAPDGAEAAAAPLDAPRGARPGDGRC